MMDNIEALQAGHIQAMENQIYDLSVHTLAGEPEDILPYYLETSMSWQNSVIRSKMEPFFPITKHAPQPPLVQHIQILCITLGILMQQSSSAATSHI